MLQFILEFKQALEIFPRSQTFVKTLTSRSGWSTYMYFEKHKPETVKCHFKNAMFIVMSSQALEIFARPEIFCKNYHLMVWTLVKWKPEVSVKLPALRLQTYSWFCNRN